MARKDLTQSGEDAYIGGDLHVEGILKVESDTGDVRLDLTGGRVKTNNTTTPRAEYTDGTTEWHVGYNPGGTNFRIRNETSTSDILKLQNDALDSSINCQLGAVVLGNYLTLYSRTDANRGAAGTAGRIIFNTDDGAINVDDGTNWQTATFSNT